MLLPRSFVLIVLCCASFAAQALTRTWPSASAPCDTTLQACIDGSAAADTVEVAQNTVIDETLLVNKPMVLRAARGYSPKLNAGRLIAGTVNATGSWLYAVEGFELQQGFISLSIQGGTTANVRIRNNRILQATSTGAAEISVFKTSTISTTVNYDIAQNELYYFWDTFDGALRAALQVLDNGSGNSSGRISGNRITATGNSSIGILVSTVDRTHRTEVLGNQVLGGRSGSIYLRQGSLVSTTTGQLTGIVLNNVVRSAVPGTRLADGIKVDAYDGTLVLNVLHNTVVDAFQGLDVYANPTVVTSGEIGGNLFAYLASSGLQRSAAAASIGDRDNLFFQTSETPATPGLSATSVFADPLLKGVPHDPHLRPDSPAVDRLPPSTLSTLLDADALPQTDGDGLRRFKFASSVMKANMLDIGALEAGDETLLFKAPSSAPGNNAAIDHPALNGYAQAMPQVVANWNPDGVGGIYNNHPLSLLYVSGSARWVLRQEDLMPFSASASFNLFAPGQGSGRYRHLNTAANISGAQTQLDDPDLNGQSDYVLLITRNSNSTGTITDVVSPLAAVYSAGTGRWNVRRLDGVGMPANGGFNVYFQEPSHNAFRHYASAGNTFSNTSDLDHPLLNGNRCARIHVTQGAGTANVHHIGVFYVGAPFNRWSIFNQDSAAMPLGAEFHVVVDPQAVNCPDALFGNGFE